MKKYFIIIFTVFFIILVPTAVKREANGELKQELTLYSPVENHTEEKYLKEMPWQTQGPNSKEKIEFENAKIIEEYYLNATEVPNFAYMFNLTSEDETIHRDDGVERHGFEPEDLPDNSMDLYINRLLKEGFIEVKHHENLPDDEWEYDDWTFEKYNSNLIRKRKKDDVKVTIYSDESYLSVMFGYMDLK